MNKKSTRQALTRTEVEASLRSQLKLLTMACAQYDGGLLDAGKYIAVTLRVLLHQAKQSKSLLEQLGMRSERFYSTAEPCTLKNLSTSCNLVLMRIGPSGAEYIPQLSAGPWKQRKILFAEWWNDTVLIDVKRRQMNRRDIILHVANTEGAHVDPELDEAYMDLSRNNSLGYTATIGGISRPFPGPHMACIRQIAHEVLITLQEKRPDLFDTPYSPADLLG